MKNVRIKICGRQFLNGESDENIVEAIGVWEQKEGASKLIYDEWPEENGETVHSTITFSNRGVKIEKRGGLVSDLFFVANKERNITYKTPYGVLAMESRCKKIEIEETEQKLNIHIEYDIYASKELLSENITEIRAEVTDEV